MHYVQFCSFGKNHLNKYRVFLLVTSLAFWQTFFLVAAICYEFPKLMLMFSKVSTNKPNISVHYSIQEHRDFTKS